MSTVAVFAVLAGGGAYAASKIGASDIAKNAVRSKHIKANQVKASEVNEASLAFSRIVARPRTDTDVIADSTPSAVGLTGATWTAKADEIDDLLGYVEAEPVGGGCTNPTVQVTFSADGRRVASANPNFSSPDPDDRYPINNFGQAIVRDNPEASEPVTITAEVSGQCFAPVGPIGGTVSLIRAAVVGHR